MRKMYYHVVMVIDTHQSSIQPPGGFWSLRKGVNREGGLMSNSQ